LPWGHLATSSSANASASHSSTIKKEREEETLLFAASRNGSSENASNFGAHASTASFRCRLLHKKLVHQLSPTAVNFPAVVA
jgi:hypothetical protein